PGALLQRRRQRGARPGLRGGARHPGEEQAQGGAARAHRALPALRHAGARPAAGRDLPRAHPAEEVPMTSLWWKDQRFLIAAGVIVIVLAVAYALDFTRRRR